MRIPRIFQDQSLQANSSIQLDAQATAHLTKVLRLKQGHPVILFNGRGGEYHGEVEKIERRQSSVFVEQFYATERESPLTIVLAQCLARGERMDYAIQKAVEVGVNDIYPLRSAFSAVQLSEDRAERRLHHWQQVVISACEQCGRNRLPVVHPVTDINSWITAQAGQAEQQNWILSPAGSDQDTAQPGALKPGHTQALLVGPEGGFNDIEMDLAARHQFSHLTLGTRILRTETAAVVAATVMQTLAGDYRQPDLTVG